ncbi:heparan-alpha-glucosaminide N-acetyltransferase-like isoform X2 [Actinia tenebrosa]|uniref:Heparan-alpha-glucosaminide N-acetyltransferase-like isoform X2 n=1 Tax=Actinia tenebrosa TaxID=6105 RepID=A0A6P8HE32_ACTTE|nr:heparan-alpha-glucosaminide N-acetyltransferase-like isoform X2 [Actinia tenebrosa]
MLLFTVMAVSSVTVLLAIYLAIFTVNIEKVLVQGGANGPYDQPKGPWNGKFKMDTALVNITNTLFSKNFSISGVSSNCYQCDYQVLRQNAYQYAYVILDTKHPFKLFIQTKTNMNCTLKSYHFQEYKKYQIGIRTVDEEDKLTCSFDEYPNEGMQTYFPLFVALGVLIGMAVVWILITKTCRKYHLGARWGIFDDHESLINAPEKPAKQKRLNSLDTFRGIALTIMIFVNYGGGGYYFFNHARWNGLTVADLVFPWFMWIMGVSITLSFRGLRQRQVKKRHIFIKIIKRTVILFLLGLFTSNLGDLTIYRVPGVLQRFAACYFVVALVQLIAGPNEDSQPTGKWWDPIRDVVVLWPQWCFMIMILVIYIIFTYAIKVKSCPIGYTGPGGIGEGYPEAYNCTGGVASRIDEWIFKDHVYHKGTFKDLYRVTVYHDPEGALGTLTSIFLVFLGVQAGITLYTYATHRARVSRWLVWSVILGCLAIGLSGGTQNEGLIPINKNLWSVSFIFATGSMAFILLAVCYLTVDVFDLWNGAPFIYPGMNSIAIYCGSELIGEHFPFSWNLEEYHTHGEQLLMNLVGTGCWLALAYYMYYIEFFVKI